MKSSSYLSANFKRNLKLMPKMLLTLAVMTVLLSFIGLKCFKSVSDKNERKILKIGMVGNTADTYLGIGIDALKNMDAISFEMKFIPLSKSEAVKQLKSKSIDCFVVVPDDFVDNLVDGEETHLTYVTSDDEKYLGAAMMRDVASKISVVAAESQTGIYSMHKISYDAGLTYTEIYTADEALSLKYISAVLNRSELFDINIFGISDGLSSKAYYFCGILFFFLMMWGIFCTRIFIGKDSSYMGYLKSRGIGGFSQITGEYSAYFLILFIIFTLLCTFAGFVFGAYDFGIAELHTADVISGFLFAIKLIPVLAAVTAFEFFLFEAISSPCAAILAQFICSILFCYLGGCFYPISFFSVSFQKFIYFCPNGALFTYIRQALYGNISVLTVILAVLYAMVFFAATVIIRSIKIRRMGK